MARSRFSNDSGFSLLEVIIAMGVMTVGLVSLAQLFALSIGANHASRTTTFAVMLAQQKMEQLRGLTWGFDPVGLPVSDVTTNSSVVPQATGCPTASGGGVGTGLSPSPSGTLGDNVSGWVDYLDLNGCLLGGGSTAPARTIYIRRWSVEPLPTNPNNTVILQVLVTRRTDRGTANDGNVLRMPEEARMMSAKTRKIQMRPGTRDRGFTLIEMMVSMAVMTIVMAGVFSLLNPAHGTFQAEPEVSDMQQRLRVAADGIQKDLIMAGAGMYSGSMVGTLDAYFSPLLPHRVGTIAADPAGSFRANPQCPLTCASAVTIMYVPTTTAQTTINTDMPTPSAELKVTAQAGCPENDQLCGFKEGMRVLIMNPSGAYDIFTITNVQDNALHLQHRDDKFTTAYPAGSWITQIVSHTYYLEDNGTDTFRLRHYDGYQSDLPLVDNVVDFRAEFFGDPSPPIVLKPATDTAGPWTTYGPRPPMLGQDNDDDPWAAGENCLFKVDGGTGLQVARPEIQTLGLPTGPPVLMPSAMLTDGPWCPSDKNNSGDDMPNKYDADMLRVRQVRITLRVQVSKALLRGPASVLFRHAGISKSGERFIPDQEIRFDVSPRNLNLGR